MTTHDVIIVGAGIDRDPAGGGARYDPETCETNVPNLFLAGGVVAGRDRAPVFIENGRHHGAKAVVVIRGRLRR